MMHLNFIELDFTYSSQKVSTNKKIKGLFLCSENNILNLALVLISVALLVFDRRRES